MNTLELKNYLLEIIPLDEIIIVESEESIRELVIELAYFGITEIRDLSQHWLNQKDLIIKQQSYERNNFKTAEAKEKCLKNLSEPWSQNRIGIIRNLLAILHGPYWELYKAGQNDVSRKVIIQKYFSSPYPVKPIPVSTLVRYRKIEESIQFVKDFKLRFTPFKYFKDEINSLIASS